MSGPLAQSAERGADNAKVVSSTLRRTTFFLTDYVFGWTHVKITF